MPAIKENKTAVFVSNTRANIQYTMNERVPTIQPINGKYRVALLMYSGEWSMCLGQGILV
jgi:hypothetical protein